MKMNWDENLTVTLSKSARKLDIYKIFLPSRLLAIGGDYGRREVLVLEFGRHQLCQSRPIESVQVCQECVDMVERFKERG